MFNLDLSGVKSSSFSPIPEGTYNLMVDEADVKDTKAGTGQYINCKMKIVGGEYDGRFIFTTFNFKNDNAKAVEIGLQQLKNFMECAGMTDFALKNVVDLVGHKAGAVIKIKSDSYGDKNVVSYYKPLSKEVVATKGKARDGTDVPF